MPRDARATKARLLKAATEEFAAYGIAGARVDRIAASAGANKNLLYVHFGNKERLFDAVFAAAVQEILAAAPFDATDLPGYAGALFDFHLAHPHLMRLARWHSLERAGTLPVVEEVNGVKLRALAQAQAAGRIDASLPPALLLPLLVTLSGTWSDGSPEADPAGASASEVAARRAAVVTSVARLTGRVGAGAGKPAGAGA